MIDTKRQPAQCSVSRSLATKTCFIPGTVKTMFMLQIHILSRIVQSMLLLRWRSVNRLTSKAFFRFVDFVGYFEMKLRIYQRWSYKYCHDAIWNQF